MSVVSGSDSYLNGLLNVPILVCLQLRLKGNHLNLGKTEVISIFLLFVKSYEEVCKNYSTFLLLLFIFSYRIS